MNLTDRRVLVAAAVLAQGAIVGVAVAGPLSARVTGQEYLLRVAPYDPIDPFRGAYVSLSYPDLTGVDPQVDSSGRPDGMVYVALVQDGQVWKGRGEPQSRQPATGPYVRCENEGWRLRCGIESLFLPQGEAAETGRLLADGSVLARIKIDSRGNAALIELVPPG